MNFNRILIVLQGIPLCLILLALLTLVVVPVFASVQEASTNPPVCGNNIKETGEQCDGDDLGGESCTSLGYSGGILSCNSDCTSNVSQCVLALSPSSIGRFFPPILFPPKPLLPTGDFNGDGFINFIDLSILLYWFEKTGQEIILFDLNQDEKINYVDVSILLYRWKD